MPPEVGGCLESTLEVGISEEQRCRCLSRRVYIWDIIMPRAESSQSVYIANTQLLICQSSIEREHYKQFLINSIIGSLRYFSFPGMLPFA